MTRAGLGDGVTRWVCWLGLLGALPLVLLTPPLQVADEPQHFERAYQISRFDLLSHAHGHAAGAMLPVSIPKMVRDSLGTIAIDAPRPITVRPLATTLKGLTNPLNPEQVSYAEFTGAAPYSPLPYIPQAIAIAIGRSLGMGPLALLYAARLANVLASILMLTFAVRIMPIAREALAFAGLMPMALYQYASASPDAMTIASTLLFTAISMRAMVRGWSSRDVAAAAALGMVFCSHKLVYAPMLLIGLVPPVLRAQSRIRAVIMSGIVIVLAIGPAMCWLVVNSGLMLTREPGTDIHAQAALLIQHPIRFLSILSSSLFSHAPIYYTELVGTIGWLAMPLPPISYALAVTGMLLSILIRRPSEPIVSRVSALWQLLMVLGGVVLIELALYVTWNPVGSPFIEGVQGRYFLPLLGLFLLALHTLLRMPQDDNRSRHFTAIVLVIAAVQGLALDTTIISAYSLF